jgi:hypothetical protein
VSVIVEICELVAPLCNDSQRVFEEGNNDQKATECGQVAIQDTVSSMISKSQTGTAVDCSSQARRLTA